MSSLLLLLALQQGGLDPDLAGLLARVPEPRTSGPSVFNVVSSNRLYAGDQLNVLTGAWLSRSLRLRLRQPPSLTPPVITGVWATPRTPVSGAVATREGDLEAYDLFVVAQTVYPLNPGPLTIPAARLSWVEPARVRGGQERHVSVASSPFAVQVRALPLTGQPAQFPGTVGRDLTIEYRLVGSGKAGAVVPVQVAVSGTGSLPLWPAPPVAWPQGARAYDQGSDVSFGPRGGRLGGTRVFRFAMVPDSAGGLSLPPLEYPYFDPITVSYRVARNPGVIVPILEAGPITSRRNPVSLLQPDRGSLSRWLAGLPGYVLWSLLMVPGGLIAGISLWRRYPRKPPASKPITPPEQLELLVRSLLPPGAGPSRDAITTALRKAGLPLQRAERLALLHQGLEARRYGRMAEGEGNPLHEIARELALVPRRIRRVVGIAAMGLAGTFLEPLEAQTAYELYNRGDYAAAADVFRAEARQFPDPARWYNVAAAEYMSGRDAQAAAALLGVRERDPRDPQIRTLWNALAREHGELRRIGGTWLVTADELLALAVVAMWLGLGLFLLVRRWPAAWLAAFGLAAIALLASASQRARESTQRAVLAGGASQRISPHGLAPNLGAIPAFTVVRLVRQSGGWWLVETDNSEGWVPAEILVPASSF